MSDSSRRATYSGLSKCSISQLGAFFVIIFSFIGINARVTGGAEQQCPVECGCLGNLVTCSGLQLIGAPSGLPPWTVTLELKDNNIANLESDALLHLTKLKELDISENKLTDNFTLALMDNLILRELKVNKNLLTQIPDLAKFKNLTSLSLSHNLINEINGRALLNLSDLQNLDLSFNSIAILKQGSFLAPNHLTHLNLNANQINVIQSGSLNNLTSIRELRLNKNYLTQLKDLFTNLENLRLLEINRNELQHMHGLSLKGLKNLEDLRLRRNKIAILDDGAFYPLTSLLYLHLDFNMLTVVKRGALFGLNHLQKLTLSHNRISIIDEESWDECKELLELDLSHNNLISIGHSTFKFLNRLETLKLDHNQIEHISDDAFKSTSNLQVLELNANNIKHMIEDTNVAFTPLINLQVLGLAHNNIKFINKNAFNGLRNLTQLDLTGNNITSIQEDAFVSMPNLVRLKVNTRALLCDRESQWLSVWLQQHTHSEAKIHCDYPNWLKGMPLAQLNQANFTFKDDPKPKIIEGPVSQMSIKGDNVTLICRATSSNLSPLNFTWKHDNVEIINGQVQEQTIYSDKTVEASSTLHLTNITHSNAGKYQCLVANNYGTTYSLKAKISVLIYPSFLKIPQDFRTIAGSTARLECSAEGLPSPQIAWQKDGGNDFPAARERRMHMMPTDDVLFIVNVKTADSGVYSCTAQNVAGHIVANATLTILETPSFVKPMENKEITVGESIVLECMAGGSPRPKLSWRKNGSPLQATERHFFTAEDQLLIIVNTIASDAGSYECEMNNSLGSVVGASLLTVNPAPNTVVNEDDILGLIIITVVCCAVFTSVVWVVIIYQTRRHLNASSNMKTQPSVQVLPPTLNPEKQLYLDTSSQHSRDSGTGDSTNPSSDQLQMCLPEEGPTCSANNEEDQVTETVGDPLLRYTNHDRQIDVITHCGV